MTDSSTLPAVAARQGAAAGGAATAAGDGTPATEVDLVDVESRRLRIAMLTPVPPAASGIADYVAGLLPLLPDRWEVVLFSDTRPLPKEVAGRAACRSLQEWVDEGLADGFDLVIHQVGNDLGLIRQMERVRRDPGLLVLHDPVLHPARVGAALRDGRPDRYREVLRRACPRVAEAVGHAVASGLAGPSLFWRFPLCEDLVRASRLTVVHGRLLAGWLRALVPGADVAAVTHWHPVASSSADASGDWRRRLGAADAPLLGTFGHVSAAHRLDVVLEALARLAPRERFHFVVAGSVDESLGLPARARELGMEDRVHWLGRLDDEDFGGLMAAVDIGINLRYPTARASSGTLQQLLQTGTPVLVSDLLHLREIPDEAVARIPPSGREAETGAVVGALRHWLGDPDRRAAAGRAARRWARAAITPRGMADSYRDAVRRALSGS